MTGEGELAELASQVGAALGRGAHRLVTAESCTGGGIAWWITTVPGSSGWFDRGFVTYSDAAKRSELGVREQTLREYGAVSVETVEEMVRGALARSDGDVAVAVTGIAGPGGATPGKPVGTVCLGWQVRGGPVRTTRVLLGGDRTAIRTATIRLALQGLVDVLN